MNSNAARQYWKSRDIAREQRRLGIALEVAEVACEDCGGRGVDPGSLMQPEPCPSCAGSGVLRTERAERMGPGRASDIKESSNDESAVG